jgi:YD repeat-containing protein
MKRREFITRTMPSIILLALRGIALAAAMVAVLLPWPAATQAQTFRDASGRITGTASRDANGTVTYRDGSGRMTGTATRDANGTTTFRDASGRIMGTRERERRMGR